MENHEVIFFLHTLRDTRLFRQLKKSTFTSKYLQAFYWLVSDFHEKYKSLPFDYDNPSFEQIQEILSTEDGRKYYMLDDDISQERNKEAFLSNCKTILDHDYSRYNKDRVKESTEAWINWENFQDSFVRASEYMKSAKITPENISDVITKANNILRDYSMISLDDDLPRDFFDPETHKLEEADIACWPTGWENYDLLLNDSGVGSKGKNLVIFVGAPNIGKSIFLGNVAVAHVLNGANTLMISTEMEERDLAHRISVNVFDMTMDEYSSGRENIDGVIETYLKSTNDRTKPIGRFFLKRMYSPSPRDIDRLVLKTEAETGEKINVVVIDYLTEMGNDEGIVPDNAFSTYLYHKNNCGNLFDNAGRNNYLAITAHQSSNIDQEAIDMTLKDLAESKGILHSPDSVVGILQTTSMKMNNEYALKSLKARHSRWKNHYVKMKIDYRHMRLTCGIMLSPDEWNLQGGTRATDGGLMSSQ